MKEQNNSKVPQIRFKGFVGEWEKKPLNQVSDVRDGTHESPKYQPSGHPLVTSKNVKDGWINYDSVQFISSSDFDAINQRSKVDKGDILMGMIGTIGNTALIREDPDFAIKNVALIKLSKAINENYLYQYFQTQQFNRQLEGSSEGGTQKFISLTKIRSLVVTKSSLPEQTKIGGFFRELDSLIGLHQHKHDKLVTLKKTMLQKMFPQPGAATPEIRFKGFSGDWVEKKLGDSTTNVASNTLSRANLNYRSGLARNVHYGDILVQYKEVLDVQNNGIPFISDDAVATKLKSSNLANGDIVVADAAEDEMVGKCTEIQNVGDQIVLAGLHTIALRPLTNFAPFYLGYYLNSDAFHDQLLPIMQGTKVLSISKTAIKHTAICFPIDEAEQQKIGTYFHKLDELISKHAIQLQKLTQIKSACLEKMFV